MPAWNSGGFGEGGYGDDALVSVDLSYSPPPIDHLVLGLSRVITQYLNSSDLIAWLTALLKYSNQQEDLLQSMLYILDPSEMTGVNLDRIAEIVGTSRYVDDAIDLIFFGFEGEPTSATFGEAGQPQIGSRFYETGEIYEQTNVLGDPELRLLIGAQIIKNSSQATPEDILKSLSFLFGTNLVNVDDNGGMVFTVSIGVPLTNIQAKLLTTLDLLPRPAGVLLGGIVSYDANAYFGFNGQPNALPFGEYGVPNTGGIFAEEII
jgi:hypothetical protein